MSLFARSFVVSAILSFVMIMAQMVATTTFLSDLSYDTSELESMSYKEAMNFIKAHSKQVSPHEHLFRNAFSPFFWKSRFRLLTTSFVVLFFGCVWMGTWHSKKQRRNRFQR